jgi:hypothetical protein
VLNKKNLFLLFLVSVSIGARYCSKIFLESEFNYYFMIFGIVVFFALCFWVLQQTARVIEETTTVLSEKTKIASGVLQSFGTAFPDMILGVVAAITSLSFNKSDYVSAISYAVIAASTTFGSNIYNIGHAAWCVFRQNLANNINKEVAMFPLIGFGGQVKPMAVHKNPPSHKEMDGAIDVLNSLSLLTSIAAIFMVLFGKIEYVPAGLSGDYYQLIKPVGVLLLVLSIAVIFFFRKSKREKSPEIEIVESENYFRRKPIIHIWLALLLSGVAILFSAEVMVHLIKIFSEMTGLPVIIAGVLSGVIGCLGEMLVVHDFTVSSEGRIGDAITGVAMDNIVTIAGASIVAIMGGIFLGGNALILIFVIILCLNTVLIWQISRLKNYVKI